MQKQEARVSVKYLCDRNATVAEVSFVVDYGYGPVTLSTATGSSKREPGDVHDDGIGLGLAVSRALINLGQSMERNMNKAVAEAAAERAAREAKTVKTEKPRPEVSGDGYLAFGNSLREMIVGSLVNHRVR
jgi:hypothetical protein